MKTVEILWPSNSIFSIISFRQEEFLCCYPPNLPFAAKSKLCVLLHVVWEFANKKSQMCRVVYTCKWIMTYLFHTGRRSSLRLVAYTHNLHKTFLIVPSNHRHARWAPRAPCELTRRHSSHVIKMIIDFAVIDIDFAVIKLIQPWSNSICSGENGFIVTVVGYRKFRGVEFELILCISQFQQRPPRLPPPPTLSRQLQAFTRLVSPGCRALANPGGILEKFVDVLKF